MIELDHEAPGWAWRARLIAILRAGNAAPLLVLVVLVLPGVLPAGSRASTIEADRGFLMPQVPSGIGVGMAFDNNLSNPASEVGLIDYVWGASSPGPTPVYHTAYLKYARDSREVHPTAWWKANHPTWLEYKCNKRALAIQFGHKNAPLDITNPEVLAYQWQEEIEPRLSEGYGGIAFDNLELTNESRRCGHFNASGQWVQQFTGHSGDPAFTRSVLEWAVTTRAEVHAYSPTATMSINYSYEPRVSAAANMELMDDADLVFDERGMSNWGQAGHDRAAPALWLQTYESARALQAAGACYELNNEFPGPSSAISAPDVEWAVANYLLLKGACTYISISGFRGKKENQSDYGTLHWYTQYEAPIGEPLGPAVEEPSGAYSRGFTGGLALVNPTLAPTEVILPPGDWYDGQGALLTGSVTLVTQQAAVLTSTP
jgi:Hypothetical glycosyl hydrolase family 15